MRKLSNILFVTNMQCLSIWLSNTEIFLSPNCLAVSKRHTGRRSWKARSVVECRPKTFFFCNLGTVYVLTHCTYVHMHKTHKTVIKLVCTQKKEFQWRKMWEKCVKSFHEIAKKKKGSRWHLEISSAPSKRKKRKKRLQ